MAYKRYIEAVGLAEVIENLDIRVAGKPARWNDAKYSVLREISQAPDADVEEVKHGYWITDEKGIVICSECGEEHAWDEYRATYCEDCGAKMDGERSDA